MRGKIEPGAIRARWMFQPNGLRWDPESQTPSPRFLVVGHGPRGRHSIHTETASCGRCGRIRIGRRVVLRSRQLTILRRNSSNQFSTTTRMDALRQNKRRVTVGGQQDAPEKRRSTAGSTLGPEPLCGAARPVEGVAFAETQGNEKTEG